MADGHHFENITRNISATSWPLVIKFGTVMVCALTLQTRLATKKLKFENLRRPTVNEKTHYLHIHLSDIDNILHGDAHSNFLKFNIIDGCHFENH